MAKRILGEEIIYMKENSYEVQIYDQTIKINAEGLDKDRLQWHLQYPSLEIAKPSKLFFIKRALLN